MADDDLLFERRGSTAVITFNRPQARNAMTFAMYEALHERCEEVDADDAIRVLVLRGAGGRAFVSGTDIRQFLDFDSGRTGVEYEAEIDRYVGRLDRVRKPAIALVEGYAVGAGLAIAAACDLRICTPGAQFGLPIARTLGNCLSMAGYARLVAILGAARTLDVVFTARMVGAEEARASGLATEVVAEDEIEAHVLDLAERLATHAPITMRATKEALRRLREANIPDGADLVEEAYGSDDFRQGVAAFLEKRRHTWTGTSERGWTRGRPPEVQSDGRRARRERSAADGVDRPRRMREPRRREAHDGGLAVARVVAVDGAEAGVADDAERAQPRRPRAAERQRRAGALRAALDVDRLADEDVAGGDRLAAADGLHAGGVERGGLAGGQRRGRGDLDVGGAVGGHGDARGADGGETADGGDEAAVLDHGGAPGSRERFRRCGDHCPPAPGTRETTPGWAVATPPRARRVRRGRRRR